MLIINQLNKNTWLAIANIPLNTDNQSIYVRQLLSQLLTHVNINDQLDDNHFPYRLKNTGYFICFSHSKNRCAVIISKHHAVGIDIEMGDISWKVVHRYFHHNEIELLSPLSTSDRQKLSNQLWQIKECLIKINHSTLMTGLRVDISPLIDQLIQNKDENQYTMNIAEYKPVIITQKTTQIRIDNVHKVVSIY